MSTLPRFALAVLLPVLLPVPLIAGGPADDGCGWRRCELEAGPLSCGDAGETCDMFRNLCVPACQKGDCCAGVRCPAGTACAPGTGRCGVPVGDGCFDMGATWWTGRDIPPEKRQPPRTARPVRFEIRNDGGSPLYFASTSDRWVRFDLHLRSCGGEQRLELAPNHYCSTPCPVRGPARERDCGPPHPAVRRLRAGGRTVIEWSGMEEVGMRRLCGRGEVQFCQISHVTVPGTYTVEVCAFSEVAGGEPDAGDPDLLAMATPKGERRCRQVELVHPATPQVVVRFGS